MGSEFFLSVGQIKLYLSVSRDMKYRHYLSFFIYCSKVLSHEVPSVQENQLKGSCKERSGFAKLNLNFSPMPILWSLVSGPKLCKSPSNQMLHFYDF
jgi:hypothetical protein